MNIYLRHAIFNNFGDGINNILFSFFTKKNVISENYGNTKHKNYENNTTILGCGSILEYCNSNDIVYGTGIMYSHTRNINRPKQIISVRGLLTKKILDSLGFDCPERFGDPALLLPFIFPPYDIDQKYELGIIPHYIDKDLPVLDNYKNNPNVLIIDIFTADAPYEFIKNLCSCKKIISSTLHGIIVGDAYGIPSHHTILSDKVAGGTFKFEDYYSSCQREYYNIELNKDGDIDKIISEMKEYKCQINIKEMIENFPFIDEIVKNECIIKLDNGFMNYII